MISKVFFFKIVKFLYSLLLCLSVKVSLNDNEGEFTSSYPALSILEKSGVYLPSVSYMGSGDTSSKESRLITKLCFFGGGLKSPLLILNT
jgi:hypothetical protein